MTQSWIYLITAIFLEVSGTVCMKVSNGFTRTLPSILIFVFYGLSFVGLTLALKKIDIGAAYAIWSGIGAALITIIGIVYFREPASALKLFSVGLIIIGVVGLNSSGMTH